MDVFRVHQELIDDYRSFTTSAVVPLDPRIKQHVQDELAEGKQWPEPWLSLNPTFASGGSVDELVADGLLHPECAQDLPRQGSTSTTPATGRSRCTGTSARRSRSRALGKSYVLTTGTGSGKSLAYIVPIVDRVLRQTSRGQRRASRRSSSTR